MKERSQAITIAVIGAVSSIVVAMITTWGTIQSSGGKLKELNDKADYIGRQLDQVILSGTIDSQGELISKTGGIRKDYYDSDKNAFHFRFDNNIKFEDKPSVVATRVSKSSGQAVVEQVSTTGFVVWVTNDSGQPDKNVKEFSFIVIGRSAETYERSSR